MDPTQELSAAMIADQKHNHARSFALALNSSGKVDYRVDGADLNDGETLNGAVYGLVQRITLAEYADEIAGLVFFSRASGKISAITCDRTGRASEQIYATMLRNELGYSGTRTTDSDLAIQCGNATATAFRFAAVVEAGK